jgi:hypothetical protein
LKSDNLEVLSAVGIQTDFIPAGYTGCLQVMDNGVNKPANIDIRGVAPMLDVLSSP